MSQKKVFKHVCYTDGFSIYAMSAEAESGYFSDISQNAVDLATINMELNFPNANHKAVADDVFNFMKENHQIYDVIVLDPPAFIKSIKSKHTCNTSIQTFKHCRFKSLSTQRVEFLFTFSCSQVIDDVLFYNTVAAAAIETWKKYPSIT